MTTTFETTISQVVFTTGEPVEFAITESTTSFTVGASPAAAAGTLNDLTDVNTAGVSDADVLTYDFGSTSWIAAPSAGGGSGIPESTIDAKGDILVGSADDTIDNLAVGTNGKVLMADSAQTLGVKWAALASSDVSGVVATSRTISTTSPITGGGDLSANRTIAINDGTTSAKGAVQLEDSTSSTSTTKAATPNSVKSAYDLANAAVPKSLADAKGDLFVASADNTVARLAVGTDTYVLTADSGETTGVKWAAGGSGVTDLDDLADVDTTGASDGDVLTLDSGTWIASPPSGGGGGLVLVDSGTFSGSSTPHFDNVFDAAYTVQRVVVILSSSAANFLRIRLRASGTDNSTGSSYTGAGMGYTYTEDKGLVGAARTDFAIITFDTINAAAAAVTTVAGVTVWGAGSSSAGTSSFGFQHSVSTAYDGFTLYDDSSGTLAGSYWVYGYPT